MKTYTDELTPVDSAVPVHKAANWYEREVSAGVLGNSLCGERLYFPNLSDSPTPSGRKRSVFLAAFTE